MEPLFGYIKILIIILFFESGTLDQFLDYIFEYLNKRSNNIDTINDVDDIGKIDEISYNSQEDNYIDGASFGLLNLF